MINDNIRKYRKEKGISQEEMAVRLHVVRQTVSKWENGKSVPDAEALIGISKLLEVPVSKLLGAEVEQTDMEDLTEELARVNEQLAGLHRKEDRMKQAGEKRGLILFLSFAAMFLSLAIKQEAVSLFLSGVCILAAVVILYRNLTLLTSVTTEDMRLKVLRITTVFNAVVLVLEMLLAVLTASDVITFSAQHEQMFAVFLVACVMIFAGMVSPKLPFTRHTGLRLPWTVRDEETWNLAHRILGILSLPLALLYVVCSLTSDRMEEISLIAMLLWIGIPGGISYLFYWKKMHGRIG